MMSDAVVTTVIIFDALFDIVELRRGADTARAHRMVKGRPGLSYTAEESLPRLPFSNQLHAGTIGVIGGFVDRIAAERFVDQL